MAPPLTLSLLMSSERALAHASTCGAKASLISTRSISSRVIPDRSRAAWIAGTGPMPITLGSTPTLAHPTSSASGLRPWAVTAASLATTMAAA
eukprot:6176861-Pleurochrysis_carterae.AAC.4